jgi:hypothetical protein
MDALSRGVGANARKRSFMPDQGIDHEKFFGLAVKIR